LSDWPQLPVELQREVVEVVDQTRQRSGWPIRRTLAALEISSASYYRWRRDGWRGQPSGRVSAGSVYRLLECERRAILDYALSHPEVRHRELAWRMLDEGVCGVSPSSVYRVLREEHLVCRWRPKGKVKGARPDDRPTGADQQWQTDIKYVRVGGRNYYLLSFLDVWSRYIVHHRLLRCMDGLSVSIEAAAALGTLSGQGCPTIQSDYGSGFVAREFAETLGESGVTHRKIRPHTPTDNAEIERYHRTIGDRLDEETLEAFTQAESVIDGIIDWYNHRRLHSALSFLRPVDYYRGDPEALLAERRRKLQAARTLRKQENLRLRQRLIPWPEAETVSYPRRQFVSL